MNSVLVYEINRLLEASNESRNYKSPATKDVVRNILLCYAWSLFVATWSTWGILQPLHSVQSVNGLTCLPTVTNEQSELFLWFWFFPCTVGFPYAYIFFVVAEIWRRRLLPPIGNRARGIAIFFIGVTSIFVVVWVPVILTMFAFPGLTSIWLPYFTGLWSHLQGSMTSCLILCRRDVRQAFIAFMGGRCNDINDLEDEEGKEYLEGEESKEYPEEKGEKSSDEMCQ